MTSFGWVPPARVWPCARWVEAKPSPPSIASQTPTATASWPIATCRKPARSPARKRSSTFSSKRRIRSISRRSSRCRSFVRVRVLFSTFATGAKSMLRAVRLVDHWREIHSRLPADWADARLHLVVDDEAQASRTAALLGPTMPGRSGRDLRFYCSRSGVGARPLVLERLLARLDAEVIAVWLELEAADEPIA